MNPQNIRERIEKIDYKLSELLGVCPGELDIDELTTRANDVTALASERYRLQARLPPDPDGDRSP